MKSLTVLLSYLTCSATLTPWRQNPTVHRRIHKSQPPVPILSQLDQLYTPSLANVPKIHSKQTLI
jgi:hypothetical protein